MFQIQGFKYTSVEVNKKDIKNKVHESSFSVYNVDFEQVFIRWSKFSNPKMADRNPSASRAHCHLPSDSKTLLPLLLLPPEMI